MKTLTRILVLILLVVGASILTCDDSMDDIITEENKYEEEYVPNLIPQTVARDTGST